MEPRTSGYRFVAPSLGVRTCIGPTVPAGRSVPGRGPAGTRWVHTEPAGRGAQRARAVTTGAKEPQVSSPAQPPPGTASGDGPEFESPHPTAASPGLAGEVRAAEPGEVKRVGSDPMILPLAADGGARVEVAAAADDRGWALGPLAASAPPPARPGDEGPGRAARPPNRDGAPQRGRPVVEHGGPKGDGDPIGQPAAWSPP